jgi:hypothetical protein
MDQPKQQQLSIEIKPEMAKGSYSNLAVITHSPTEFIIDFVEMVPGIPKPEVVSRIIMTPEHAKRLLRALNENIGKYEAVNGQIVEHQAPQNATAMPFGPAGEA